MSPDKKLCGEHIEKFRANDERWKWYSTLFIYMAIVLTYVVVKVGLIEDVARLMKWVVPVAHAGWK